MSSPSPHCPTSPCALSAAPSMAANDESFAERGEPHHARAARVPAAHLRRQGPGLRRLGDPAAARSPATTGRSSGSACRA